MDAPHTPQAGVAAPALETLADRLRAGLREWYDVPVVRISAEWVEVPAGNAVDRAQRIAGDQHAGLVRPIDMESLPWFEVPSAGLRLWRAHGAAGDERGELVTELIAGDPSVQVVVEHEGWLLTRARDGATGWIEPSADGTALSLEQASSQNATALGDSLEVPAALADEAEAYLGAPYRWGGTTEAGIDCSGIVQRAAWHAGQVWLPRHSRHLLHVGRRVSVNALERGDVLVLKSLGAKPSAAGSKPQTAAATPLGGPAIHPMHVAIALSADEVLHASRDAWAVVREPLASLLERYRVLGARRFDGAAHGSPSHD